MRVGKKKITFFPKDLKRGNTQKYFVPETLVTTAKSKLSSLVLVFSWMTQFCAAEEFSAENLLMTTQLNEVE